MSTRRFFWAALLAVAALFSCCAVEAAAAANFSDVAHPFVKRNWVGFVTTMFKNTMVQGAKDMGDVLSLAKGALVRGADPVQKANLAFQRELGKLSVAKKALAEAKSGSHIKPLEEDLVRAWDGFQAFDPARASKADLVKLKARVIAADAALTRARNPPELVAALKKQRGKVQASELRFLRADYEAKLAREFDKVRVAKKEFRKNKIPLEAVKEKEEKLRVFLQTDTPELARIRELEFKLDPVFATLRKG